MKTFAKSVIFAAVLAVAGTAGRAADPAPAPRIEWEGKVNAGYERAVKEKKLLVVYFRKDYCEVSKGPCRHCTPIDTVLGGVGAGRLAGKAVWVWQSLGADDEKGNGAQLMKDLKIEAVPVLVVLEVARDKLTEVGRVTGKFDEATYLQKLRPLLGP